MKILIFTFLAFIAIGMPEGALGIAWPSMRYDLGQGLGALGFISISSLSAYTLASFLAPLIKLEESMKTTIGLIFMSLAFFLFANAHNFYILLIFSFLAGFSIGFVDTSVNTFMTRNFTSRYINWLNCFFGVGATISPLIFAAVTWRIGYNILSAIMLMIGLAVLKSMLLGLWKVTPMEDDEDVETSCEIKENKLVNFLNVFLFFLMAGIEYSIGMLTVTVLIESRGLYLANAGMYPALYFSFTIIGRVIFGILAKYYSNMNLLRIGFILASIGLMILLYSSNIFSMVFLGFGMGPVFPCLMHETKKRVPKNKLDKQIGYQLAGLGLGSGIIGLVLSNLLEIFIEILFPVALILLFVMFLLNEKANNITNKKI